MASQYLGQQVDRDGLGMVDVLPTLLVLLYGTKRDPPKALPGVLDDLLAEA